ncbi:MAG: hypothetical protein Q9214_000744, partial [Letrouitia sp. 1 TL-2023]
MLKRGEDSDGLSERSTMNGDPPERIVKELNNEINSVEPIAIVGMSCRLPREVRSPSQLWKALKEQRSGQCKVPKHRWNVDAFYHPDGANRPGSMNTSGGYFLQEDTRNFENSFFGINDLEATYMDPQQRKLLEVTFECFESAGVKIVDLAGSKTGCYVGNFTMDFLVMQARDPEYFHRYTATGMGTTILANRISHVFDLCGPSVHTAMSGLRNGDCDAAIVAGANLAQFPEQHMATIKAGVLSGTSTCRTFDVSADGYGRAEGVAAIYIKRLSDAVRDGDPIRSIIRGSAVNSAVGASNGRTPGITSPSVPAQVAVIRRAHETGNLDLNHTAYIECHGTGTMAGDSAEVKAISQAFAGRPSGHPLLIGGVKPNFGHSEAASGITAIIKASLALESGHIPATIGVHNVNPDIKKHQGMIEIVTKETFWPIDPTNPMAPKRIGVNSFGYGGANAHIVLEASNSFFSSRTQAGSVPEAAASMPDKAFLLPFSASTTESLNCRVDDLSWKGMDVANLAYTLCARRSRLSVPGFIVASQEKLEQELCSNNLQTLARPNNIPSSPFAFIFTGQGAQWAAMGRGFVEQFPTAVTSLARMDAALRRIPHGPVWSLNDLFTNSPETGDINEPIHAQPACTALQVMLVDVLLSWGIKPGGVLGHSSGEIAAAYAAGLLTAEQAIIIAYYRGHVVGQLPTNGQMMAVGLSQMEAEEEIHEAGLSDRAVVACINSPDNVTLSGDADVIDALHDRLSARNVFRRKLHTKGRAYHSHHMVRVGQDYEDLLSATMGPLQRPRPMQEGVCFISSVTTREISSAVGPDYWRRNLESPVMFSQGLETLSHGRRFQLIELGPHAALKLPISQLRSHLGISEADLPYYNALTRGQDSANSLLTLMGNLFLSGRDVPYEKVNAVGEWETATQSRGSGTLLKDLPPYHWTYDRILWNEPRASEEYRNRIHPRHELLGSLIAGGNLADRMWRNVLRVGDLSWLKDHKVGRTIVYPAAAYLAMACEAISQAIGRAMRGYETLEFRNIQIVKVLTLSDEATKDVELFTSLRCLPLSGTSKSSDWYEFEVVSVAKQTPIVHATGTIGFISKETPLVRLLNMNQHSLEDIAVRSWYVKLAEEGLNFGESFQSIKSLLISRDRVTRRAEATTPLLRQTPDSVDQDSRYHVHPITIDAMLQACIMSSAAGTIKNLQGFIPVAIDRFVLTASLDSAPVEGCKIMAQAEPVGPGQSRMCTELYDEENQVHAQISGVRMTVYEDSTEDMSAANRNPMLRVVWKPDIFGLGLPDPEVFSAVLGCGSGDRRHSSLGIKDNGVSRLLVALDFIVHKSPGMRILLIAVGESLETLEACLATLGSGTAFPRFRSITFGRITDNELYIARDIDPAALNNHSDWRPCQPQDEFDVAVYAEGNGCVPQSEQEAIEAQQNQDLIFQSMELGGLLLSVSKTSDKPSQLESEMQITNYKLPDSERHITLRQKSPRTFPICQNESCFVVVDVDENDTVAAAVALCLKKSFYKVDRVRFRDLAEVSILPGTKVIVTVEMQSSLLAVLDTLQMNQLKYITDNASSLVWITSTTAMDCPNPDTALVGGLARSLMLEQPSLRFYTLDIDGKSGAELTAQNVYDILAQPERGSLCEFEFIQRRGALHVSRFVPDADLNESFRQKQ